MKPRLLYFDTGKSSFVLKDLEILKACFEVKDYTLDLSKKWRLPVEFSRQFLIVLVHGWRAKAVVVQFAGFQSYVPFLLFGLLGKKRVVVAGGTDCVAFPSIDYGNFARKYLRWFTKKSFEMADLILPVHESLISYAYTYQDGDYLRQGYKEFTQHIRARETVIYNGYDTAIWYPREVTRKRKTFLTVGANLNSRFGYMLKGIDLFVELAKSFPDCDFAIVGAASLATKEIRKNLTLLPAVPNKELPELYSSFEFYVQLSMSEGFPNALTEAILCGCVPIVSNVGAMAMIVGNPACILKRKDKDELIALVKNLISNPVEMNFASFAKKNFPVDVRKEQLIGEIEQIIGIRA